MTNQSKKTDITFDCYAWKAKEGTFTIFQFWPDGTWDEMKYSLEEALVSYPPSSFNWIKANDDE